MTSARRQTRAGQGLHARPSTVDGASIPAELLDPVAGVWTDPDAFLGFMIDHGWTASAAARQLRPSHPQHRRMTAAAAWAAENNIAIRNYLNMAPAVDHRQLRRLIGAED